MVSSLSFIRVIAAICHSEGNVPVDKYLYPSTPRKVRQHNQDKEGSEREICIFISAGA